MANATTAEGAIVAMLIANAGVGAIVGNRISTATGASKNAYPKMYYERIGTTKEYSNDGVLNTRQARIYLYASADDLIVARAAAAAAESVLDGFSGTASGISFGCIRVTDFSDDQMPINEGQTKPPQRVRLELTVDYYQ